MEFFDQTLIDCVGEARKLLQQSKSTHRKVCCLDDFKPVPFQTKRDLALPQRSSLAFGLIVLGLLQTVKSRFYARSALYKKRRDDFKGEVLSRIEKMEAQNSTCTREYQMLSEIQLDSPWVIGENTRVPRHHLGNTALAGFRAVACVTRHITGLAITSTWGTRSAWQDLSEAVESINDELESLILDQEDEQNVDSRSFESWLEPLGEILSWILPSAIDIPAFLKEDEKEKGGEVEPAAGASEQADKPSTDMTAEEAEEKKNEAEQTEETQKTTTKPPPLNQKRGRKRPHGPHEAWEPANSKSLKKDADPLNET